MTSKNNSLNLAIQRQIKKGEFKMVRYLNCNIYGINETIDQLSLSDFKSFKDFKQELKRLKNEYNLSGCYNNLRWSQRACKGWNK